MSTDRQKEFFPVLKTRRDLAKFNHAACTSRDEEVDDFLNRYTNLHSKSKIENVIPFKQRRISSELEKKLKSLSGQKDIETNRILKDKNGRKGFHEEINKEIVEKKIFEVLKKPSFCVLEIEEYYTCYSEFSETEQEGCLKEETISNDFIKQKEMDWAVFTIEKSVKSWLENKNQYCKISEQLQFHFLQYSAIFIQRNWRGYSVRKGLKINSVRFEKQKIRALFLGWKTRRILCTKEILVHKRNIKDLEILLGELRPSQSSLYFSMLEKYPSIKEEFIHEFYRIYFSSYWMFLKTEKEEDLNISNEKPIRPLLKPYSEIAEEESHSPLPEPPKKVFNNFLKKGTRNNYKPGEAPKKPVSQENEEKIPNLSINEGEEQIENQKNYENLIDREPLKTSMNLNKSKEKKPKTVRKPQLKENPPPPPEPKPSLQISPPVCEETRLPEETHKFLKRKSKLMKPTKIQWNAKPRIDCWVETEEPAPSPLPLPYFYELEQELIHLLSSHTTEQAFFTLPERVKTRSIIPQISYDSVFVRSYVLDSFTAELEMLESKYCSLLNNF